MADPFLDGIQSNPGNSARLTTLLLPPPPPPPPDYREIEGFRVQLFAGTDSTSALTVQNKVNNDIDDPVYLIHEGGLFKIQVGDYPYRIDADNMKLTLNTRGYDGAWVAKRKIHVPRDSSSVDSSIAVTPSPPPPPDSEQTPQQDIVSNHTTDSTSVQTSEIKFKIQVIATSDELKAQQMELDLEKQFAVDAYYKKAGDVYKVFIGQFQSRPDAEVLLKQVRENGFPDAWLVY
ncbi:MAG: SPOR domain-containing protein [Calditrichaceae bacterium]